MRGVTTTSPGFTVASNRAPSGRSTSFAEPDTPRSTKHSLTVQSFCIA
jgi:hypothetical protein